MLSGNDLCSEIKYFYQPIWASCTETQAPQVPVRQQPCSDKIFVVYFSDEQNKLVVGPPNVFKHQSNHRRITDCCIIKFYSYFPFLFQASNINFTGNKSCKLLNKIELILLYEYNLDPIRFFTPLSHLSCDFKMI